jgi:hypothetical protein
MPRCEVRGRRATRIREWILVIESVERGTRRGTRPCQCPIDTTQRGELMSLRTRLLLTIILAVFLGCHAYVAFIVLPAARTDWQKSDLTQIGVQD